MSTEKEIDQELVAASIQRDLERWHTAHVDLDIKATGRIRARMIQSYQDLGMQDWQAKAKVDDLLRKRALAGKAS